MNKEQIIDKAYETYNKEIIRQREIQKKEVNRLRSQGKKVRVALIELLSKEEFINKCKTDSEFSEKWGLKIEERELSEDERQKWVIENIDWVRNSDDPKHEANKYLYRGQPLIYGDTVPTRLITLTYDNKTIESYE